METCTSLYSKKEEFAHSLEINLASSLVHLSRSLDFSSQGLLQHHQRVALLSLYIGKAAGLKEQDLFNLFTAAIIHDVGAVTWNEKRSLHQFEVQSPWEHCQKGYEFLSGIPFLDKAADIVLSHHDTWAGNNPSGRYGTQIPLPSRIIYVADRVDVLINDKIFILQQSNDIIKQLQKYAGSLFDPDLVAVVADLTKVESLWMDLTSSWVSQRLLDELPENRRSIKPEDLSHMARLYARVVDAKSPFTHRHSQGVALIARSLAEQAGLPKDEVFLLNLAGLLHDIGKLSVPEEIIQKPGSLTAAEFSIMKQHTYYTYWWLKPLFPSFPVAEWAAYHHERLDGQGYPFHKGAHELDTKARIVAVADIFTALREERPYRSSLTWGEIERIIYNQVRGGALDGEIADILFENRGLIDDRWTSLSSQVQRNSYILSNR
ncbi:MAG: metal dependent phosphohydrolase [Peptococcaceae bacterium]|nr:metal dependent phosphohydrolase [Peptococcaceae bacterium]